MSSFFDADHHRPSGFYNPALDNMVWGQLSPHLHLSPLLLEAFKKVPRPTFVPSTYREYAYSDKDIPLFDNKGTESNKRKFLLSPLTSAKILSSINFEKLLQQKSHVLILSGGTGYTSALLGKIGVNCYVVETQPALREYAQINLKPYPSVSVFSSLEEVEACLPKFDFFEVTLFDGGSIESIPQSFFKYLTDSGYMLAILASFRSVSKSITLCQGVKISSDQQKTFLFDAIVPSNSDYKSLIQFKF